MKHSLYIIMILAAAAFAGCADDRYVTVVHGDGDEAETTQDAETADDYEPSDDMAAEAAEELGADTDGAEPEQTTCINQEKRCNGDVAEQCSGAQWYQAKNCETSQKTCYEGECVECKVGDVKCDGEMIAKECRGIGLMGLWKIKAQCNMPQEVCYNGECAPYNPDICQPHHCKGDRFNGTQCKIEPKSNLSYCECADGYWWNGTDCVTGNPCEEKPCNHEGERLCEINAAGRRYCECNTAYNYHWNVDMDICSLAYTDKTCDGKCTGDYETECILYYDGVKNYICGCEKGYAWDMATRTCAKVD